MIFLTIIGVYITYILFKFIIRPKLMINFYKKQGFLADFYPFIGPIFKVQKDLTEKKDFYYSLKEGIKQYPNMKGFSQNQGSIVQLILVDPELVKEFLQKQTQNIYKKPDEIYYLFKKGGSDGLVFAEGQQWKRHRKILSTTFHYEFLKQMMPSISQVANELFNKQMNISSKNVKVLQFFQDLTSESVNKIFFGDAIENYTIDGEPFVQCLTKITDMGAALSFSLPSILFGPGIIEKGLFADHRYFLEKGKKLNEAYIELIQKKFNQIKKEKEAGTYSPKFRSLIDIFYDLQQSESPENYFTPEEILAEFRTFYSAGSETTAHLISMSSYYYLTKPEYQERLLKEIDECIPDFKNIDMEALNKMEFMTAFQKETLRLYGPAPFLFDREVLEDHSIGDIKVKKGTHLNVSIIASNYNPKYHQEPEVFNPDRWINDDSLTKQSVSKNQFVYLPFSAGPRNCIGQHMAMFSGKVVLSLFVKKFNYKLSDPNYKLMMNQRLTVQPLVPIEYDLEFKE